MLWIVPMVAGQAPPPRGHWILSRPSSIHFPRWLPPSVGPHHHHVVGESGSIASGTKVTASGRPIFSYRWIQAVCLWIQLTHAPPAWGAQASSPLAPATPLDH
jgi:hypothetical protein